jgi:hypothetical protein
MAAGLLRPSSGGAAEAFRSASNGPPDAAALLAVSGHQCVFHEAEGRCAIHRALGHDALPLACRQFPRVSVLDPRGVSVTLSHYCPTAAAMLDLNDENDEDDGNERERAGAIVKNAAWFPAAGEYVGLDAREVLPPLLRPGVLMDWDSWWETERLAVETLLHRGSSAAEGLSILRLAVRELHQWSPGSGPLIELTRAALMNSPTEGPLSTPEPHSFIASAFERVPDELRAAARWTSAKATGDQATRRFLAAHAFANWEIHSGDGLTGWLRSIETAHAFLMAGAGVRHADLVLRHLVQ